MRMKPTAAELFARQCIGQIPFGNANKEHPWSLGVATDLTRQDKTRT